MRIAVLGARKTEIELLNKKGVYDLEAGGGH